MVKTSTDGTSDLPGTLPHDHADNANAPYPSAPECATPLLSFDTRLQRLPSRPSSDEARTDLPALRDSPAPHNDGQHRDADQPPHNDEHSRNIPGLNADAQGGQPPDRRPPVYRGPAGNSDDAARRWNEPTYKVDDALRAIAVKGFGAHASPQIRRLSNEIAATAIGQLMPWKIQQILERLEQQVTALAKEQMSKIAAPSQEGGSTDARVESVLAALAEHIAFQVLHSQFNGWQFNRLVGQLTDSGLGTYAGTAACLAALSKQITPDSRSLKTAYIHHFVSQSLQVLRNQTASQSTEELRLTLPQVLRAQCDGYSNMQAAHVLIRDGLPALQHQWATPANRDMLRALMPYAHRFFNQILPALRDGSMASDMIPMRHAIAHGSGLFNGYSEGLDVLDALRGVQYMRPEPGNPAIPDVNLILIAVNQAVTTRMLDKEYSLPVAARVLTGGSRNAPPRPEKILATLIYHLRHHFSLASAAYLVDSVHQWLGIGMPVDLSQLRNSSYRNDLMARLMAVASNAN